MSEPFTPIKMPPWIGINEQGEKYAVPESEAPRGITLDLMDIYGMISRAVGAPIEGIVVEYVAVKQDRTTGDFDGAISVRSLTAGKRYSLKFTGTMEEAQ